MFDYLKIKQETIWALGEGAEDFDVDAIVDEISYYTTEDGGPITTIDDLDSGEFWSIVERFA